MAQSGDVEHFEFLTKHPVMQRELVDQMQACFDPEGSQLVWNKSFEMGCNARVAALLPEAADFLLALSARTHDLLDPFKSDYVDVRFRGSTSIKHVLPVLSPSLGFDQDAVHDGAGAMEACLATSTTDERGEKGLPFFFFEGIFLPERSCPFL